MKNFEVWGTKNCNCAICEENERCKEAIVNNQCFIKTFWTRHSFVCPHCNNKPLNMLGNGLNFHCNQCSSIISASELNEHDTRVFNFMRQEQPFVGYFVNEGTFNFYSLDVGLQADFHAMFCFSRSEYAEFESEHSLQFYTSDYGVTYNIADNKSFEKTKTEFHQIQELCKHLLKQDIPASTMIFISEDYVKLGSISEILKVTDIDCLL